MLGKDIFITCHGYQKNLAKLLTKGERISNIPFHVTIAKHVNFFFTAENVIARYFALINKVCRATFDAGTCTTSFQF